MERRLAEIPTEDGAISRSTSRRASTSSTISRTPSRRSCSRSSRTRTAICSRGPCSTSTASPCSRREAVERRDRMIEHLAALPPVQGALDQIVHRFGTDQVAEVTGRSRRIVEEAGADGGARSASRAGRPPPISPRPRPSWTTRSASWCSRTPAAPGAATTPTSPARNQRRRVHYLLEPGWKADAAIQGLGRTNRTNQKQPPLFRPIATNVKGEKRFLSTIARRLDTLGAITSGQRQTGGQGLFRAEDNLESAYARAALRQFYALLFAGKIEGCSLQPLRGRHRARPCRPGRLLAGGPAADHAPSSTGCWRCRSRCRTCCSRCSRRCSTPRSRARSQRAATISASRR